MTNPTSSRLDLYTDAKGWFDTIRDFSGFSCDASDIIAYQQATFNGAFENCKSLKKLICPKAFIFLLVHSMAVIRSVYRSQTLISEIRHYMTM